ncbi:Retrovirus-related Pol polyprotein from transposon TNT 1-94, partial [Golovinomyces cichoracearum]
MGNDQSNKINDMVDGLDRIKIRPCVCNTCMKAKITRTVNRKPMTKVHAPGDRLHIDLFGPLPCKSLQGNRIMITYTDQNSKMVDVDFLPNKKADSILNSLKRYIVRSETTFRKQRKEFKLRCVHCDRGKEFLNHSFSKFLQAMRCELECTVGYMPEANGIAERCNRIILEKGQALRIESGLPEEFWEFAFTTASYLRNRGPVSNRSITPWEAWFGERPSVAHLRVFGCPVVVHIPKEKRTDAGSSGKLAIKGWDGIFVGYNNLTPTEYIVWDPLTKKSRKTRH